MDTDLVEYLVVVAQDLDSLGIVAAAIAELVATETIQILDLVAVAKADDSDASLSVFEFESVPSLAALRDVEGEVGGLLSDRDIDRAAAVREPGTGGDHSRGRGSLGSAALGGGAARGRPGHRR